MKSFHLHLHDPTVPLVPSLARCPACYSRPHWVLSRPSSFLAFLQYSKSIPNSGTLHLILLLFGKFLTHFLPLHLLPPIYSNATSFRKCPRPSYPQRNSLQSLLFLTIFYYFIALITTCHYTVCVYSYPLLGCKLC